MRTRGFAFELFCFPLREWGNWQLHRQTAITMACVGPLRVSIRRLTLSR